MIEEIQAILPLLDKISDGALYAFLVFMLVQMMSVLVWPFCFVVLVKTVPRIIKAFMPEVGTIDVYRLHYKGKDSGFGYIGTEDALTEFFKSLAPGGSYIHTSDLLKFAKDQDATPKGLSKS